MILLYMAKKKITKKPKRATNINTNKNKNVVNIKIDNSSKKKRSKSKGKVSTASTINPYSSFNPTIAPNIYLQPNYPQQMVGSGYRDAVYPTQNTRMDMQIPQVANPLSPAQEPMFNPYADPIYETPIMNSLPSLFSSETKSLPDSNTVSQVDSYSSMASFPYSTPSALFDTEKFNIDNAKNNMSESSFPIYDVFDKPAFNEEYKEYENPMELKKKREAKDAKKINKINKQYYSALAMDELQKSLNAEEWQNVKFTQAGIPNMNTKYGKKYKEILTRMMEEDK